MKGAFRTFNVLNAPFMASAALGRELDLVLPALR